MRAYRTSTVAALTAAGLLLAAVTGGRAHGGETPAAAVDPVPALLKSQPDMERGRALFVGTCSAYCHRPTPGPGDAPYLFDCDWLHGGSDAEIFHTIAKGVPNTQMVAFGGALPDEDIWRLVAYVRSASVCKK